MHVLISKPYVQNNSLSMNLYIDGQPDLQLALPKTFDEKTQLWTAKLCIPTTGEQVIYTTKTIESIARLVAGTLKELTSQNDSLFTEFVKTCKPIEESSGIESLAKNTSQITFTDPNTQQERKLKVMLIESHRPPSWKAVIRTPKTHHNLGTKSRDYDRVQKRFQTETQLRIDKKNDLSQEILSMCDDKRTD